MVFTKDSFSVRFWLKRIGERNATKEDVPALFNLQEVVFEVLAEQ